MNLFNRIWQLKIAIEGREPKIYQKLTPEAVGLHITFTTEVAIGGTSPSGSITITGLPLSDIEFLSTSNKVGESAILASQVELQAGYDDSLSIILFGNLYEVVPNFTTPDYSISMRVMNGLQENQLNAFVPLSMKGRATLRDILANLAKQMKKTLQIDHTLTNRALQDFSFQGSPTQLIKLLKSYYPDIDIFNDNTLLKVQPKKHLQITPKYKITPSSGLVNTPKPTPMGCEIQTLLLPNLSIGDHVELQSHKLHRLDGIYQIVKLTHTGSSRDNNYYSNMTLNMLKT